VRLRGQVVDDLRRRRGDGGPGGLRVEQVDALRPGEPLDLVARRGAGAGEVGAGEAARPREEDPRQGAAPTCSGEPRPLRAVAAADSGAGGTGALRRCSSTPSTIPNRR